jgi:hypothetical protein
MIILIQKTFLLIMHKSIKNEKEQQQQQQQQHQPK